jgi:hypothetical protein
MIFADYCTNQAIINHRFRTLYEAFLL